MGTTYLKANNQEDDSKYEDITSHYYHVFTFGDNCSLKNVSLSKQYLYDRIR